MTARPAPEPARHAVVAFTAGLAVVGGLAGMASAVWFGRGQGDWLQGVGALALLTAAAYFVVNFRYRNELEALDLFEAALAPVMFVFGGWAVVVMVGVANLIAECLHRVRPMKAAFNVAQWMAAAGIGSLVFAALGEGTALTRHNAGALAVAMVVVLLVNHLAFAGAMAIVEGHSLTQAFRGLRDVIVPGWLIGGGLNLAFGLLFVAAYEWTPTVLPLFFVPLFALHWAGGAYAAARADEVRLRALHRASAHLGAAIDPLESIDGFLDEVRDCFEAEAAELVVVDTYGDISHRVATGTAPLSAELTEVLLALEEPSRLTAQAAQPEGWRDCLAAPLFDGSQRVGVLVTYNRTGLEGFEDGELSVLVALADDVVAALQRGRLVQQVMDERRKLREIVDSASDGILSIALDGTVRSWNPALENITGYDAEHVLGRDDLGVLRPRDSYGADVLLERWPEGGVDLPRELQILTRAGEVRWLSCSYSRVAGEDGAIESLIVIARDVTKVREVERLREDFVATVSHELRTPLAPIKGWASTLLALGDKLEEGERNDALQSILRQSQRLERLIVNLLEVSKIEHGASAPEIADVDVTAVVDRVVSDFRAAWPNRGFVVDGAEETVWGHARDLWVEQILSNLVSNAVKYSPDDKPVELTVERGHNCIRVVVVDQGCGIPAHELERVFDRFHRGHEVGTQTGTGLGLYIARHLANEIGGSVSVQSVLGRGSRFTLEIPAVARVIDVRRSSGTREAG